MAACLHCHKRRITCPRGLCRHCYRNKALRRRYPPLTETGIAQARRHLPEDERELTSEEVEQMVREQRACLPSWWYYDSLGRMRRDQ